MLDPLIRLCSFALASCLGWTALDPERGPDPRIDEPVVMFSAAPPAPSLLEPEVWRPDPELAHRYDLDPFYTPDFVAEAQPKTRWVWARVTACSPHDSPADIAYYKRYGYEGATYNIAADPRVFPKGTKIRVPGYMEVSYPGKFWEVDSGGGSIIRRSTAKGVVHIDVKFRTLYSVKQWGSQYMWIEVQDP